MKETITIDPSIIYFTHSKIRNKFSGCGKYLHETVEELKTKSICIEDIPKITVIKVDSRFISMNNRRLWVFKECKYSTIEVYVEYISPSDHSKSSQKLRNNTFSLIATPSLK